MIGVRVGLGKIRNYISTQLCVTFPHVEVCVMAITMTCVQHRLYCCYHESRKIYGHCHGQSAPNSNIRQVCLLIGKARVNVRIAGIIRSNSGQCDLH